jgi:hypothetical protein
MDRRAIDFDAVWKASATVKLSPLTGRPFIVHYPAASDERKILSPKPRRSTHGRSVADDDSPSLTTS